MYLYQEYWPQPIPDLPGISSLVSSKDLWPLVEPIDLVCLNRVLIEILMSPFSSFLRVKEIK
jgi:hypothetical protein